MRLTKAERRETNKLLAVARKKRGLPRTTAVLIAAIAGILAISSVFAVAAFTQTNITLRANGYGVQSASTTNFPNSPQITIATDSSGSCVSAATLTAFPDPVNVALNGTCHAGNWGLSFDFPPAGTATTGSDQFIFSVVYTGSTGGTYTESATFTETVPAGLGTVSGQVVIILDFGEIAQPSAIQSVSATCQGT